METKSLWLLDFQQKNTSQCGEDGIIEKILDLIPEKDGWCVEFGAWDGLYLSNTLNLIPNHGYKAVLLEGDPVKFRELTRNFSNNSGVIPIQAMVCFSLNHSLDHVLRETNIPLDFDLLSIDIDGNDYHVWSAICTYRPKVLCIEFNSTIATGVEFIQKADARLNHGSSLSSLVSLGTSMGYELVCVTEHNAFFVLRSLFHLFSYQITSLRFCEYTMSGCRTSSRAMMAPFSLLEIRT